MIFFWGGGCPSWCIHICVNTRTHALTHQPQQPNTATPTHSIPPLDSSSYPSIGRGISYLDPTPLNPPTSPDGSGGQPADPAVSRDGFVALRAYRSESQVGFWPLKSKGEEGPGAVPRGYRCVAGCDVLYIIYLCGWWVGRCVFVFDSEGWGPILTIYKYSHTQTLLLTYIFILTSIQY